MSLTGGVARSSLTPWWGVELAGWGYYLGRTWQRVRDHTAATALVLADESRTVALAAVDLMYLDAGFTEQVRTLASRETGIPHEGILVGASHSHNTPTTALIRGAGEADPEYTRWAARQTATAIILAWKQRQPVSLRAGHGELPGWTFNRTRENGPVDPRVSVWRVDARGGAPLAVLIGFQAHPTTMMALGAADLSRDWPGVTTDAVEQALPGATALYFQGACGDINFRQEWAAPDRCAEPGKAVAEVALRAWEQSQPVGDATVGCAIRTVTLPTRPWTREEIQRDREEAEYRLRTGDTAGWLEGMARVIVNKPHLLPERYGGDVAQAVRAIARFGMEWTEAALQHPEGVATPVTTEVQAIRVGSASVVSNPAELFTSLALEVRAGWTGEDLVMAGYANDSIGYLPDAHDIEKRSYAAYQSPKFKGQQPFTVEAGQAMVRAMLDALRASHGQPRG